MRQLKDLQRAIGNTPMAEIQFKYKGQDRRIFAKLEYYNLTGSVKDRMAYAILEDSYKKGEIKPGDTIVEATSGNTGISFCGLGAYLGHPVVIYMPDWMSEERKKLIASFGAQIRLVSHQEGGFLGSISKAEALGKEEGYFLPRQFENPANTEGQYKSLGLELVANLGDLGLVCDGFVAGVGTGGTVMGVAKAVREANPKALVCPLEPEESPTLSTGNKVGAHRIAGISDEFIPDLCKLDQLDHVVGVSDGDSIIMAQILSRAGLGVGISSGGNFLGALKVLEELGQDAVVATVFADDSKKYLSTDLTKEEPIKEGYLSKDIEIQRVLIHR